MPTEKDIYDRTVSSQGQCSYLIDVEDYLPYVIPLGVTLVAVPLYSLYQAYLARDIASDFAESGYMYVLSYCVPLNDSSTDLSQLTSCHK